MIVIFRGQDTHKHKIEIIFQLPIIDDEYKVEQKLEDGKKLFHFTFKKKITKKFEKKKKTIEIKANNKKNKKVVEKKIKTDPNSPFAVLEKLL